MKDSEVSELLTFMAAFDRRIIGEADVLAWSQLDVCQRYDLATCKAAVVKFFNQYADERGNSHYLDPQQFKSMVRLVRTDQRRSNDRFRSQVLGELSEALHNAGKSYEEIEEARRNLLRDDERLSEQGASPEEVRAFLESQRPGGQPTIESGTTDD